VRVAKIGVNILKSSITALLLLATVLGCAAFAASSANYAISAEVFDYGGASMESTSYLLTSKLRDTKPENMTSSSFSLESRFMGIVAATSSYSTFESPVVTSITPDSAFNDKIYHFVINGSNISFDATVRLTRGALVIYPVGNIVTVDSSVSMEASFDLSGVQSGGWDVVVTNTGWGRSARLVSGLTVSTQGVVKIVGIPVNDPNPFNPDSGPTHIKYKLTSPAAIGLYMFNQKGEIVWKKEIPYGANGGTIDNDLIWDGTSDFREDLPTGVYVLKIVNRTRGSNELGGIKIAILRR
jgi:hypothetical protein